MTNRRIAKKLASNVFGVETCENVGLQDRYKGKLLSNSTVPVYGISLCNYVSVPGKARALPTSRLNAKLLSNSGTPIYGVDCCPLRGSASSSSSSSRSVSSSSSRSVSSSSSRSVSSSSSRISTSPQSPASSTIPSYSSKPSGTPISVTCCENPISSILSVSITGTPCACISGSTTFDITHGPSGWEDGDNEFLCGERINLLLFCLEFAGSGCTNFVMDIIWSVGGVDCFSPTVIPSSCTCDPFSLVFVIPVTHDDCCGAPGSSITVTITE